MAYMGNLQKGDRVRVTFDADVLYGSSFEVDLDVAGRTIRLREEEWPAVEFEKIEPPVEVFKPGDVVRHRHAGTSPNVRVLGGKGYMILPSGEFYRYGLDGYGADEFTSERFERVTLE